MRMAGSAMVAALAAAGALVLAGCEPSTGASGASGGKTANCDPNGFGPFSGCHDETGDGSGVDDSGADDSGADDTGDRDGTENNGDSGTAEGTDPEPTTAERPSCEGSGSAQAAEHPRWVRDARESCGSDGTQAEDGSPGQVITETTRRYTVSITWIVVRIDVTGFRECVIALRAAEPDPDDHLSHRYTTPEDCHAQRVDTVYRPIDE